MSTTYPSHFKKGDRIEVRHVSGDHQSTPIWSPATVLRSSSPNLHLLHVTLDTPLPNHHRRKDFVPLSRVRPLPPADLHRRYKVGDAVDAYQENGWRKGVVKDILVHSKYLVRFDNCEDGIEEEEVVELWRIRVHRDWVNGRWVPLILERKPLLRCSPETPSPVEARSKEIKLKIKLSRPSEAEFQEGTLVEVKSDEVGYQGSWFPAIIVELLGNEKFLVEYKTLKTTDETEPLKEEADASCIRPPPPWTQKVDRFKQLEQVDAWYNEGWWVGTISKVLKGLKYVVYFKTTNEEMEFEHSDLRPHLDWINHRWVTASKGESFDFKPKEVKVKVKCTKRSSGSNFMKGAKVEVKSDEEGYQGSWYTAFVIDSIGNNRFLVEYQTLKNDDESEQLKETAYASYIRPCPPEIQRLDRFKMLEEVDAWYNDGWWVGIISGVHTGLKYGVYFWNTNEELEFDHFRLRPHQEWMDGKWVASFLKKVKSTTKPKIGKSKRPFNDLTSIVNLVGGMKVEIGSDEEGYRGLWYPAIVIKPARNGKYLVQYQTLKTDDNLELLKEVVDVFSIRPCPPISQRVDQFKPLEEVDVWYKNGWWEGQVCKVLEGSNYSIYFRTTNEVLEFQHFNLRPRKDWIDGKWIVAIKDHNLCDHTLICNIRSWYDILQCS